MAAMALVSSLKLQNPLEVERWYVEGLHRLIVTSTGKNPAVNWFNSGRLGLAR